MPWGRLDDGVHSHPKIIAAGNAAVGVWTRMISWSCFHLTDGAVPTAVVRQFDPKGRQVAKLTGAELAWWLEDEPTDGRSPAIVQRLARQWQAIGVPKKDFKLQLRGRHLVVHDYLVYNKSRAQVLKERQQSRDRQNKSRGMSHRDSDRDAPVTDGVTPVTPSLPVPSRPNRESTGDLDLNQIQAQGYDKFKQLGGTAQAAIRRLHHDSPITQDELDAALSANIYAWGGAVRVIAQCRADATAPAPEARPRRPEREGPDERAERIAAEITAEREAEALEEAGRGNS